MYVWWLFRHDLVQELDVVLVGLVGGAVVCEDLRRRRLGDERELVVVPDRAQDGLGRAHPFPRAVPLA